MAGHAKLSPSGAHRWMACPASVVLEADCPDSTSEHAEEGTAAHALAETCLRNGADTLEFVDRAFDVNGKPRTIDGEMAEFAQVYLDTVRAIGGALMVEQRLSIGHITGEADAHGTADAVILAEGELVIVDLKYGRGVKVDAPDNDQLLIYAMAAADEFGLTHDFAQVRVMIVQPRLSHTSEWVLSAADLEARRAGIVSAAERCRSAEAYASKYDGALHEKYFGPAEKPCRFCKAKAKCPALTKHVLTTVADDFIDVSQPVVPQLEGAAERTVDNATLGNLLGTVDLIEGWCKAIRGRAEAEMLAGRPVPGWKLVEGKRGARQWEDPTEAEAALKAMRLKLEQMFDLKLISPTSAEKLAKAGDIGPRQWPKLQKLITQKDGKPSVAREDDKRPALTIAPPDADFTDLTGDAPAADPAAATPTTEQAPEEGLV